ncbi:Eco57I restriction-modification methylase domain-containing protein [Mycobacteroides abscessus]|uniref:Eco57I restriction-modification methylase domain-containing protein n=1 Tax=Mycobacteroides abscessus TaxID=36809 RepID=UPI000D3E9D05|nr:N-6 DNA methylase [Mycobacteroides abscessus]PVA69083.1 SAM-dependent methyltransferase [Mycobacteroides abscessus]
MRGVGEVKSLNDLAHLCIALGAESVGDLSAEERALTAVGSSASDSLINKVRNEIKSGADPLGDAYCRLLNPAERRPLGQTYTPAAIIDAMLKWASGQGDPSRIVDPGAGSGRYIMAAARAFPEATLTAAEIDPLSALMLRANIATRGIGDRTTVVLGDYRALELPAISGQTLFVGNPPYVRHHQISAEWKQWLITTARNRGFKASQLAGLHVHFFLATAQFGRTGDIGAFITSSEWMDVNYGSLVRQLLLDSLGGQSIHVLDPSATPFADAATTGAITCFKVGDAPTSMKLRRVEKVSDLGDLSKGRKVSRQRLAESSRWSVLTRVAPKVPSGYVELGELCRVHRGAVTGANAIWVQRHTDIELPERVLFPSVTKAHELFSAGERLASQQGLRVVVDLPVNLDEFDDEERNQVDSFLRIAKRYNVHEGYIASARKAWWSVGLRDAAPLLATYMARRPPAFVRNEAKARHINIAHGLYPRDPLTATVLDNLGTYLRTAVSLSEGRTYAGGLTKFEPKEMERIVVPTAEILAQGVPA